MRCFIAIAIVVLALFLSTAIAAASSTYKKSKVIFDLSRNFTISMLAPNANGKYDLKVSKPIVARLFGLFSDTFPDLAFYNDEESPPTTFSLKNKKLIEKGFEASILPGTEVSFLGLETIAWNSPLVDTPLNVTAIEEHDSYGKRFLRLGGNDGEFIIIVKSSGSIVLYRQKAFLLTYFPVRHKCVPNRKYKRLSCQGSICSAC